MMDALGRHLADSTVFALIVALLCLCMRRRGPAARHTLWLIAAAKFVLPMALFSWLGESLRGLLLPTQVSAGIPAVLSRWVISPVILEPSNAAKTGHFHPLIFIWLVGSVAAFALWLPKLWISCRSPNHAGDWDETSFLRLRGRIGLHRDVRLRFSDEVPEPVLAGFRRPVVIIPAGLRRQLAPAELDSVILHELAHARRWDNWTSAFAHSVTCIFWFYPLLWWIERRLHRERELACDEMVVRCGASPEDYLAGILKVCRFHLSEDVAGVPGVCGSNLKKRMEVIMSVSSDKPSPRTPKTLVGTLIAAIVGIPLVVGLLAASNVRVTYAQAQNGTDRRAGESGSQKTITCTSASVKYPEGTVIQTGNDPEQMCVRSLDPSETQRTGKPVYGPEWVHTSKAIRERSATVVRIPAGPPIYCSPGPPAAYSRCTCQGHGEFSNGALVNSAKGLFQLRCDNGNWVQVTTRNVRRD